MLWADAEGFLDSMHAACIKGQVQLLLTSPPFPLNRQKDYGNRNGSAYLDWLKDLSQRLADLLSPTGSIVLEVGNAWNSGSPTMSTLPLKALIAFQEGAGLKLCQQFIWHNPARLPSPVQWVNIKRSRVKDSFTNVWWMSRTDQPKADNRRVLTPYSRSMQALLRRGKYNAGPRPSGHYIGEHSFAKDHGGAIPPNVMTYRNTRSGDAYTAFCDERKLSIHPARMPREMAEFFVNMLTDTGDLVLDPFAGSNTTGSAAEYLNRRWIAVEPILDYVDGSRARFSRVRLGATLRGRKAKGPSHRGHLSRNDRPGGSNGA